MKVTVVLPAALVGMASGRSRVVVEPGEATVRGALDALRQHLPGVYDRLMTEQRVLRPHVNLFVGTEDTRWTGGLSTPIQDGSELFVLPSVSGG